MRYLLLISTALIFSLGLMMVYNTSSADVLDRGLDRNTHYALIKQMIYALVGISFGTLIWQIGYDNLIKLSRPLLFICIILLILVFIPGLGQIRNGARRWIGIGSFTFQPSEFVKLIIPLFFIDYVLNRIKEEITFKVFLKIVAFLIVPMFLVMLEPDNGTAAVIGASLLPLFFIAKIKFKYWALPVLVIAIIGAAAAYNLPYVRARLEVYLNPELDLKGKGHQPYQAKIAAGSGNFLGRGPGQSLQKMHYLPEAQNDYIAAIYAEEFGFLGILLLTILYGLVALGGYGISFQALSLKEYGGAWLSLICTFLITFQAFLNLGVVSGLLPSKGVNLPFFSQGGTSLIANILALSILCQIAHTLEKKKTLNAIKLS